MAIVSASPRKYFIKANGTPAAGGTLQIYDANTTTNAVTWFDRDGASNHQNANPLTLDSLGSCVVWLDPTKTYDWIAKDSLGVTIEDTKGISGATSAAITPSPWVVTGLTPTFVDSRTFTVTGDQTGIFQTPSNGNPGSRVRVTLSGGFKYATVILSVFSTLTTVTLAFQNSTDVLDATLSAADVGLIGTSNPAISIGIGSIIDLTGYSGADIALGIGQSAIYDLTAATSIPLRIATADNQLYEISCLPTYGASGTVGVNTVLLQNNAALGAANIITQLDYGTAATPTSSSSTNTGYILGFTNSNLGYEARVSTKTVSKRVFSYQMSRNVGASFAGFIGGIDTNTTTAWTSLGTITCNAVTGRIMVKRVM